MNLLSDTWIVFSRAMRLSLRQPVWVVMGVLQPILYLTLFGPLLEPIARSPGFPPGSAWQVFVPGLLVQLGIFGGAFVGFAIISEWRSGVIDRMLVTPASRTALMAGRTLRDVVVLVVQAIILVGCAYFIGLAVPVWEAAIGIVLVALLGAAMSFFSYSAGLWIKSEDGFAPLVNMVSLPILLLSGILLPMSLAPRWLQLLSDANPFKHVVEAVRAIFRGQFAGVEVWLGIGIALALVVLGLWVGKKTFEAQTR